MRGPLPRDVAERVRICGHARDAMRRRKVDWQDVQAALTEPQVVEPDHDRIRYVRDGLAYVIALEERRNEIRPVLITVLLRAQHQWNDEDARARRVS